MFKKNVTGYLSAADKGDVLAQIEQDIRSLGELWETANEAQKLKIIDMKYQLMSAKFEVKYSEAERERDSESLAQLKRLTTLLAEQLRRYDDDFVERAMAMAEGSR